MSGFELSFYGSPDCSDISNFKPEGDFFIAIEFDIRNSYQEEIIMFWFFLATKKGVEAQKYSDELRSIVIVDDYSFDFVKEYLEEKVVAKLKGLESKEAIKYLCSNFNFED